MSHSEDTPAADQTPQAPAPAPAKPAPRKPAAPRRRRTPPAPPPKPGLGWAAWVAVAVLALDQLSKWIVVQLLNLGQVQAIDVFDPWLNLRMAWNQGMNFGMFASDVDVMRWVLIVIAFAVCLWICIWIGRSKPRRFAQIAAGMLIGGALGNVVDRLTYGAVADFLNMSLPNWRNPYSFNVADIAIFLGAMGLLLQPPERAPPPKKRRSPARPAVPRAPKAVAPDLPPADRTSPAPAAADPLRDKPRDDAGDSR